MKYCFIHLPWFDFTETLPPPVSFFFNRPLPACHKITAFHKFLPYREGVKKNPQAAKQGEDVSSLLLWGPGPWDQQAPRVVGRWKNWKEVLSNFFGREASTNGNPLEKFNMEKWGFPFWKRRFLFWTHHFEVYLLFNFWVGEFFSCFCWEWNSTGKNNLQESGAVLTEYRCLILLLDVFSFEVAYVSWFAASHFISQKFMVFFVYFSVRCLCYRRSPCFLHTAMSAIFWMRT